MRGSRGTRSDARVAGLVGGNYRRAGRERLPRGRVGRKRSSPSPSRRAIMFRGFVVLALALAASSLPTRTPADAPAVGDDGAVESVRPLPFFYDLYTFRGPAGGTTVLASFAVPARRLKRERNRGVSYRFDVTLVLADTALRSVFRTDDSVFVSVPQPLAGEHLLFTQVEVEAPPSASTVQRVIMTDASTPGIGQLYTSAYPVPDYSGDHLMLSDLALGQPDARDGWTRGEATLALLPTMQFPGGSFDVYYEIYNLPFGHRYTTQISIESTTIGGGRGDLLPPGAVRTRFSGSSTAGPDGSLPELRRVEAELPHGRYRLTVTVTDEDAGRSVKRSRPFRVRRGGRGATLVPALPRRVGAGG